MKVKQEELDEIIKAVRGEVDALLKNESEELQKASPGEASPAELKEESSKHPGMEAPAEAEAPTDMGAVEPEGPADPEELKAAYSALGPDELKLHYLACKAALMEMMGHDDGVMKKEASESKSDSDEESKSMAKKEMSDSKSDSESSKSKEAKKMELEEVAPNKKFGEPKEDRMEEVAVTKLGKSESEVAELKAKEEAFQKEIDQLKKSYETLYQAMDTLLTIPSRKAVTGSDGIQPKADVKAYTPDQVTEKLKAITSDPDKLQKSDVDLINQYYAKQIGVDKIEHLLK